MGEQLGLTLGIQILVGFVVRWAKNSDKVKWLQPNSLRAIHWISVAFSAVTAAGLHFTLDGDFREEPWTLTIMGSSLEHMIIGFVGYFGQQLAANSSAFSQMRGMMSKPEPTFSATKPS